MKILSYSHRFIKQFRNVEIPLKDNFFALLDIMQYYGIKTPTDRSGFYDYPLPFETTPLPRPNDRITLDDCFYDRVRHVVSLEGNKKIMWSGGTESTSIVVSFLKYYPAFDYQIFCTESSIRENPTFYEKFIKPRNHEVFRGNLEQFFNRAFDGSWVITGYGDIFYSGSYTGIPLDAPWECALDLPYTNKELVTDIYATHVKKSPIHIKTYCDLIYGMHLVGGHQWEKYKIFKTLDNPSNIQYHIPFFGTEKFHSWYLNRHVKDRPKSWSEVRESQPFLPFKKYILDYDGDEHYYYHKREENSIRNEFGEGNDRYPDKHSILIDTYQTPRFDTFMVMLYNGLGNLPSPRAVR